MFQQGNSHRDSTYGLLYRLWDTLRIFWVMLEDEDAFNVRGGAEIYHGRTL